MEYRKEQAKMWNAISYLRAPLAVQGAHSWLLRMCAEAESSGVLAGCRDWTDRDWSMSSKGQLSAADVAEVVATGLARWVDANLEVAGYDQTGEDELTAKRQRMREFRSNAKAQLQRVGTVPMRADTVPERADTVLAPCDPHTIPAHTIPGGGGERATATTEQAQGTPPTPPGDQDQARARNRRRLLAILRRWGLPAPPQAIEEWVDLLRAPGPGQCADIDAIAAALDWIARTSHRDGLGVKFAREASQLAARWASEQRRRPTGEQRKEAMA